MNRAGLALILAGTVFFAGAHAPTVIPPDPNLENDKNILLASGICPQKRKTASAPPRQAGKTNPLNPTPENLKQGKTFYYEDTKPTACKLCHGIRGNGNGRLAQKLDPPPRNFTCAQTMREISDGQMFWIIKHGSKSTAMPAHRSTLTDRQIWQLILYLRNFAK